MSLSKVFVFKVLGPLAEELANDFDVIPPFDEQLWETMDGPVVKRCHERCASIKKIEGPPVVYWSEYYENDAVACSQFFVLHKYFLKPYLSGRSKIILSKEGGIYFLDFDRNHPIETILKLRNKMKIRSQGSERRLFFHISECLLAWSGESAPSAIGVVETSLHGTITDEEMRAHWRH